VKDSVPEEPSTLSVTEQAVYKFIIDNEGKYIDNLIISQHFDVSFEEVCRICEKLHELEMIGIER